MLRHKTFGILGGALLIALLSCPTIAQELSLTVDPTTGSVILQNTHSSSVDINGILLTADQGLFDPNSWDSFTADPSESGWAEIMTAPNRIGETNLLSSLTIDPNETIDLGDIYTPSFTPTQIGEVEPTFNFEYHIEGGSTVSGPVQFAPQNNIVLVVDPNSGEAVLENQSTYDVNINGYLITSTTDVLDPNGWTSGSMGAGWQPILTATNRLGELNLLSSSFMAAGGPAVSLGPAINPSLLSNPDDLLFEYHIEGGETVQGGIFIGSLAAVPSTADFNGDGVVNGIDFLWWQRGDTPEGGSASELSLWQSSYGTTVVTVNSASPVPEPTTAVLLLLGVVGAAASRNRRVPIL